MRIKSMRARLQLWYGLVLVTSVAGFAGILFYRAEVAAYREVDGKLEADVHYLDVSARRLALADSTQWRPPPKKDTPPPGADWAREPKHPPKKRPPPGGGFDDDWDDFGFAPPKKKSPRPEAKTRSGPTPREQVIDELQLSPGAAGDEPAYFVIWQSNGSVLKSSALPEGVAHPANAFELTEPRLSVRGDYHEVAMLGPGNTLILVGRSVARQREQLRSFAMQMAGIGLAIVALGLVGGWLVSSRLLRPIDQMARTAASISAESLDQRIDTSRTDSELAKLARVLNETFDRLQRAFERQHQFTADASHELRTPLAIIRSHAQLALDRPRSVDEYRQAFQSCLRAADRMTALVEGLLTLARSDAKRGAIVSQRIDGRALVAESVELFRPLAEQKGLVITAKLEPASIVGDPAALNQLVGNIISNAVRYNRDHGEIQVRLRIDTGQALLEVSDRGEGIAEEDQPHIFERFFRADKARSRASGGTGLGLAICKSIVEEHRGSIGFASTPGEGSTFWVRLPLATAH